MGLQWPFAAGGPKLFRSLLEEMCVIELCLLPISSKPVFRIAGRRLMGRWNTFALRR